MRDDITGYLETVVRVEWPAQAEGLIVDRDKAYLESLNRIAIGLNPTSPIPPAIPLYRGRRPPAAPARDPGACRLPRSMLPFVFNFDSSTLSDGARLCRSSDFTARIG